MRSRIAKTLMPYILSRYNPKKNAGVLYFHRVLDTPDPFYPDDPTVGEFDILLKVLTSVFDVVSIRELIDNPEIISKPKLAITFDDGYQDNLHNAVPVLDKYNIKATFFLATDGIINGHLWQDEVIDFFRCASDKELTEQGFLGFTDKNCQRVSQARDFFKHCKSLSVDERNRQLNHFRELRGCAEVPRVMMTKEDVKTLVIRGHDVGAHTVEHEILTHLSDKEALYQIATSKQHIEEWIGKPIDLFCYPNGRPKIDFSVDHMEMVRKLGFIAAFSTQDGGFNSDSDKFCINRFLPHQKKPLLRALAAAKISGERS